jgi:hypothetical protein
LVRDIAHPILAFSWPICLWNVDGAISLTDTILIEELLCFILKSLIKSFKIALVLKAIEKNWSVFITDSWADIVILVSSFLLQCKLFEFVDQRARLATQVDVTLLFDV